MYEIGCWFAFLIWIGSLVWLVISLNSQLERNLNKAGFRLSWLTLSPKPMDNNHCKRGFLRKLGKFSVTAIPGLIGIFFSWLYVSYFVGAVLYSRFKDAGAPETIKEFRWRMRNTDMTFDEVVEGLALVSRSTTPIDQLKMDLRTEMVERGNA
jgi:hypothetical protein